MEPASRRQRANRALLVFAATLLTAATAVVRAQDTRPAADENRKLFSNFLHFAVMGKFEVADSFGRKLIDNNPDPRAVLKYADEHTNSFKTLVMLINKAQISETAKAVLALVQEGERLHRQDPKRIKLNIEKLGGDPQTEFNAINRLRDAGEYAVPWLIAALQDRGKADLHNRIIRMLPKMGKDAVNPLVIALSMDDLDAIQYVARALGEIGYPQAIPYLLARLEDPAVTPEMRRTVDAALFSITSNSAGSAQTSGSDAFLDLARQYYAGQGSVQADPRVDFANVWYWTDRRLQRVEVPREIFDEIMSMRCCEQALQLRPNSDAAVALWLGANIRREAELGLDVESIDAAEAVGSDPTKQEDFPRSAYFARASGARYCHMVVDLAVKHQESAVALGAIAALRLIAGATNLTGAEDYKQPLARALTFPDLIVRIKAALALGHALPNAPFAGSDNVVPMLAEALVQKGNQYVLVIEAEQSNLNRIMDGLRDERTTVIGESGLYAGLERARKELPTVTAVFLAADTSDPELESAVAALRANHRYSMTPIMLLDKAGYENRVETLVKADSGTASVAAAASTTELQNAWSRAAIASGQVRLQPDQALALALDAVDALRKLAFSRSSVYDFNMAERALMAALSSSEEILQTSAASVLALSANSAAQQAIANLALSDAGSESLRLAVFDSLAESAKVNGNMLTPPLVDRLIDQTLNQANLTLRTAASQALGALNLPSNKAGLLINNYRRD